MNHHIYKFLAVLLSVSLAALSVTGCSSQTEDAPSESETSTDSETDTLMEEAVSMLRSHGREQGKEETNMS